MHKMWAMINSDTVRETLVSSVSKVSLKRRDTDNGDGGAENGNIGVTVT